MKRHFFKISAVLFSSIFAIQSLHAESTETIGAKCTAFVDYNGNRQVYKLKENAVNADTIEFQSEIGTPKIAFKATFRVKNKIPRISSMAITDSESGNQSEITTFRDDSSSSMLTLISNGSEHLLICYNHKSVE